MDRIMQSDRTNRSKIVVKATISEDLSGKEDPNVAKLQYLQKRNEKLNGLHTRHEKSLPSRSRQRNHSSNQNTGYGDLSDLGWMKSTLDRQRDLSDMALMQSIVDGQQPGNQHTKQPQVPLNLPPALKERLLQMTPEQLNAFLISQQRRALANRQAAGKNDQSLPAQTSIERRSWGTPIYEPGIVTFGEPGQSSHRTAGITWDLSSQESQEHNHALQDYQMQMILLEQQRKRRLMMARAENQISDTSSEKIKETDRMPFTLPPLMTNASSVVNQPPRRLGGIPWGN
jgi:hypothetical protein